MRLDGKRRQQLRLFGGGGRTSLQHLRRQVRAAGKTRPASGIRSDGVSRARDLAEAYELCNQACERFGWYNRNAAINPYLVEGKKTGGLEVAEQWPMIRRSGFPPASATAARSRACTRASQKCGPSASPTGPRKCSACRQRDAPVTEAFEKGKLNREYSGDTYADSINVRGAAEWRKAVNAVRESGGTYVNASDDQIMAAVRLTGRLTGVFAEPAAATAVAGVMVARQKGIIGADADVLAMITGNGLKDTAGALKAVGDPHDVEPSLDAVTKVVGRGGDGDCSSQRDSG